MAPPPLQVRTIAGLWSGTTSDWFQTGDGITVSAPASVSLGTAGATSTLTASFNAITTCTNSSGCILVLSTPSNSALMMDASGASAAGPSNLGAPTTWAQGAPAGVSFTVLTTTSGKNTVKWGSGSTFSNLTLLNFTGTGSSGVSLVQTTSVGTETTAVGVRFDTGTTSPGTYSGSIELIAIDAP